MLSVVLLGAETTRDICPRNLISFKKVEVKKQYLKKIVKKSVDFSEFCCCDALQGKK